MAIPNFEGLVEAMDKLEFTLDSEASKLHNEIASVGDRGLNAIKKGGDKVAGIKARVARVEQFVNKLEVANGGGPLSGSSNSSDKPKGEQSVSEGQTIVERDVGKVEDVIGVDVDAHQAGETAALAEPAASWGGKQGV